MNELLETAFSLVNLPYTVLVLVIVVYWLLVIIGLLDISSFDFDIDADADFDADIDVGHFPGLGHDIAGFLNFGEVPVMFYVSIVVLSMWIGSLEVNRLLGNESIWFALALAIPNLITGLLVAKIVTTPFKWLDAGKEENNEFEGKECLVSSTEVTEGFGECEILDADAPIKIFARTANGEVLNKGDAAVIVQRLTPRENVYLVTKYQRET